MTAGERRKEMARMHSAIVFASILALFIGAGVYKALTYPPPRCYVTPQAHTHKAGHVKAGQQ
jgi:hypothetical protein